MTDIVTGWPIIRVLARWSYAGLTCRGHRLIPYESKDFFGVLSSRAELPPGH